MPSSGKRTELLVGAFLFIGLVMLGGLILQFGRFSDYFGGQYPLTIVFDDASGLIKGSEVRMGGARIGRVARLPELNEAVQVEVELAIDKGTRIPTGSAFRISTATLLGDKLIDVIPPSEMSGAFIKPGSRQRGARPSGLDVLQSNAETVSRDVLRILKETEATLAKVDTAVDEITAASRQLGEAVGKINRSILSEPNLAHVDKTLANLDQVSAEWKETSAKLGPMMDETRVAVAAVKSAAANAEVTITAAKPALEKLPGAVERFNRATDKAGTVLDRMIRGEGMLGAFASDNEVAFDFKAFMNNLRRHGVLLYQDDQGKPKAEPKPRSHIKGRPN